MSIDISESELVIMRALWRRSPMRSSEIVEAVAPVRDWHKKTVNTLIRRLVDKGAIDYDEAPGAFVYFPVLDKEVFRKRKAHKLLSELFEGRVTPLLATFVDDENLSDADLRELRKLISKLSK